MLIHQVLSLSWRVTGAIQSFTYRLPNLSNVSCIPQLTNSFFSFATIIDGLTQRPFSLSAWPFCMQSHSVRLKGHHVCKREAEQLFRNESLVLNSRSSCISVHKPSKELCSLAILCEWIIRHCAATWSMVSLKTTGRHIFSTLKGKETSNCRKRAFHKNTFQKTLGRTVAFVAQLCERRNVPEGRSETGAAPHSTNY